MTSQDELFIQGTYNTLYNAITHPDQKFAVTHYFMDEWLPILGPSLAWLVVALRQRCYWNNRSDWCIVNKATLATEAAMQERTIERSLRKPFSDWFVPDVTHRYRYRTDLGKKVRDKNRYNLLLDEPLSPRHQVGLSLLFQQICLPNDDLLESGIRALYTLLEYPNLTDKISYTGKIDKTIACRTVRDLLTDVLQLDLAAHVDDERLPLLDHLASQLHNRIVQPNKVYVGWQYYRLNWVAPLGHSLAWIILYLRRRCYWNEVSGELREHCQTLKKDLAKAIGQTPRNLANLLDNPNLPLFIVPTETETSARAPLHYRVRLVDEPLTPDDQLKVAKELKQHLQGDYFQQDKESGQLNLFPMIDHTSNRQSFAYGHNREAVSDINAKKSREDHQTGREHTPNDTKIRREDQTKIEEMADWWQKKDTASSSYSENMTGRSAKPINGVEMNEKFTQNQEDLSDRSEQIDLETEMLSDRLPKNRRLEDMQNEKMSQQQIRIMRKNVATIKDSKNLQTKEKIPIQQKTNVAALLDQLQIQEPIRHQLLTDDQVTFSLVKAWKLYTDTQSNLQRPESYIIKRLLNHDAPPPEFVTFAQVDESTWHLFELTAQALYFGQILEQPIPEETQELFIMWANTYRNLDTDMVRHHLAQQHEFTRSQVVSHSEVRVAGKDSTNKFDSSSAQQMWQTTLSYLQLSMTKSTFDTWFKQTRGLDCKENRLIVEVKNSYAKDWLEHRLLAVIKRALHQSGYALDDVVFVVNKDNDPASTL